MSVSKTLILAETCNVSNSNVWFIVYLEIGRNMSNCLKVFNPTISMDVTVALIFIFVFVLFTSSLFVIDGDTYNGIFGKEMFTPFAIFPLLIIF